MRYWEYNDMVFTFKSLESKNKELLEFLQSCEIKHKNTVMIYATKRNLHYFFIASGNDPVRYELILLRELYRIKNKDKYTLHLTGSWDFVTTDLTDFFNIIASIFKEKKLNIQYDNCYFKQFYL